MVSVLSGHTHKVAYGIDVTRPVGVAGEETKTLGSAKRTRGSAEGDTSKKKPRRRV